MFFDSKSFLGILQRFIAFCLFVSSYGGCQYYGDKFPKNGTTTTDYSLTAQWANGVLAGSSDSYFRGIAADSSGNVYGVGRQYGNGIYTYATGVSATGSTTAENVSIVKYNNAGVAQWARSNTGGTGAAQFYAVATDSSGNIYAAGLQSGNGIYTYGAGVTATGTASSTSLNNVLIVQFDSSGTAQWARTIFFGDLSPLYYGVTVDGSNNIYAVGQQNSGTTNYSAGVSATAGGTGTSSLIVKYDSMGNALWARTTVSGTATGARFTAVATDSAGNVYAVGDQSGTGTNTYAAGVTATGTATQNILIVKYDVSGTAIWARTTNTGTTSSNFYGVTVDSSGMVYASGTHQGTGSNTYGTIDLTCPAAGNSGLLIKYDSLGNTLWARCALSGSGNGTFWSVTAMPSGDVVVGGTQGGTGITTYGSGITATGANSSTNPVWVRYASDGTARYARSNFDAPAGSGFNSIASNASGNIFAGGQQTGTGSYNYGDGVVVSGSSSVTNAVMVKYGK